jgi:hypothetical protein
MLINDQFAKIIIVIGLVLVIAGVILLFARKLPFFNWLGKLPGDIRYQSKDGKFVFYAPLVTSILISIVLTIILNLLLRIFRK